MLRTSHFFRLIPRATVGEVESTHSMRPVMSVTFHDAGVFTVNAGATRVWAAKVELGHHHGRGRGERPLSSVERNWRECTGVVWGMMDTIVC